MRTILNHAAARLQHRRGAALVAALVAAAPAGAVLLGTPLVAGRYPPTARSLAGGGDCAGTVGVERSVHLMGTLLRVEVAGHDRACALAASEAVLAEVARLERVLSSWRADSEVGRLNRAAAGVAWPVGAELWSLLEEARRYVVLTGGAFDPGVGALLDAWDLRGGGRVPSQPALTAALAASGIFRLAVDPAARTVVRPAAGWWLDTGAFGKGAALRSAAAVLRVHGVSSALLDFGGQLLVLGPAREVAVAHAAARAGAMPGRLRISGRSVSTTSSSERFVTAGAARLGHVIDPRSGQPIPAWGSVTVVAADALAADAVSTALFVQGPDAALAWAAAHPEYGVLVQQLTPAGVRVRTSSSLSFTLQPEDIEVSSR